MHVSCVPYLNQCRARPIMTITRQKSRRDTKPRISTVAALLKSTRNVGLAAAISLKMMDTAQPMTANLTIGLDLSDTHAHYCVVNAHGQVLQVDLAQLRACDCLVRTRTQLQALYRLPPTPINASTALPTMVPPTGSFAPIVLTAAALVRPLTLPYLPEDRCTSGACHANQTDSPPGPRADRAG